jgi:alanyl aminopeptidase
MRFLFALVSLAFLLSAATAPSFRLPDFARPTRYELELTIIPSQREFRGAARIDLEVVKRTSEIWLNAKDLRIGKVAAEAGRDSLEPKLLIRDEFLGFEFDRDLEPGPVRLVVNYSGLLNEKAHEGLYRKRAGKDWYAFTTFTPIEARRAFPCFDEPGYKARWKLLLTVPVGDVAVANEPVEKETSDGSGLKRVEFAETQPLPAEVVALAVGPFDVVEAGVAGRNAVPVRILTPRGRAGEAEGARGVTADILARLEAYTGIPYPWKKLDHLAVLDMPYGAVENPGLITYRDRLLLAEPARDTAQRRRAMRSTVAHELAHQWFGNLVTQAWWDDVWLSEGFATWLGTKVSDLELPEFERGLAATISRDQIMKVDASKDTRPVRLAMASRKDMSRVYGGIVYQKGGAILGMLEHWIGQQKFQGALQRYLGEHSMGAATTADLAAAIEETTGIRVGAVLTSFLDQTGFPEIEAEAECVQGRTGEVVLEQVGNWISPVCVHGDGGSGGCSVLEPARKQAVAAAGCAGWIWPNRDGAGYFRVRLTESQLESIFSSGWQQMPAPEKLSLIDDAAALVSEGRLPAEALLKVFPTVVSDSSPAVVNAGLRFLLAAIAGTVPEDRGKFDALIHRSLDGRVRR